MTQHPTAGSLVRLGFVDGAEALAGVARLGDRGHELITKLTASADPDAALAGLLRLADVVDDRTTMRNAVTLVRGKPSDQLPRDARDRLAVARVLGYPEGASDEMVNDYLRTTRRAHAVVERVFWE